MIMWCDEIYCAVLRVWPCLLAISSAHDTCRRQGASGIREHIHEQNTCLCGAKELLVANGGGVSFRRALSAGP